MKNIVVIGASQGIGNEIAKQLSLSNQVFGTYNTHPKENTNNLSFQYYNVVENNFQQLQFPEIIDGLVYCPGSISLKPFSRFSDDDFINDYKLNVIGAVKIIQYLLPNLKKSTAASIVLFSTVAVQTGMPFHSLVSSSKGAIEGLTKSLAAEFAPLIRVNCIAPSLIETGLADFLINTEDKKNNAALRHPLKKIGSVNDIASMAVFLLQENSQWMTGQILKIDGGMSSLKI